jgi:hypothetical protein
MLELEAEIDFDWNWGSSRPSSPNRFLIPPSHNNSTEELGCDTYSGIFSRYDGDGYYIDLSLKREQAVVHKF